MQVELLSTAEVADAIPRLSEILIDAVANGAGVSFIHPLSLHDAQNFWHEQLVGVRAGRIFILACRDRLGSIMGVVMLLKAWAPNQPHRGDVAKLLVHSDFRRQGGGSALMSAMEQLAQKLGLKMINFDAVAGGVADRLYRALGYQVVGIVPNYALNSRAEKLEDVVFFYKTF